MKIEIFEVGPRDGLQNEKKILSLAEKEKFIEGLLASGLRNIEVGAFVRQDRVPTMKETDELIPKIKPLLKKYSTLKKTKAPQFWALVPNHKGFDRALKAGVQNIAFFTGVTDTFVQKNIGMTVAESLKVFKELIERAREHKLKTRGYVSTAFGCPYEGAVKPQKSLQVIESLLEIGVSQVSVGDTIGVASPRDIEKIFKPALKNFSVRQLAGHFHDTRGTALANSVKAYDLGIRVFDSSAGGLGGCPYAPGASGNLATEDLVYLFEKMGIKTGVNIDYLAKTSLGVFHILNKQPVSRYVQTVCFSSK